MPPRNTVMHAPPRLAHAQTLREPTDRTPARPATTVARTSRNRVRTSRNRVRTMNGRITEGFGQVARTRRPRRRGRIDRVSQSLKQAVEDSAAQLHPVC